MRKDWTEMGEPKTFLNNTGSLILEVRKIVLRTNIS